MGSSLVGRRLSGSEGAQSKDTRAALTHSLDPFETSNSNVAAVENTAPSSGSAAGAGVYPRWPTILLVADSASRISLGPKLSQWGFLMHTSNPSDFRH